jgi:hypothetical protein
MIVRSAILVLLLLGSAAPALASEESEALFRDFVAWVDASRGWSASVGTVRSGGRDTFVEDLVISHSDPNVSTSIDRLRLRDLAAWKGGFSATGIWVDGAAIVAKHFEYAIPSAKVESITTPGMAGIAFDLHHMMSFFAEAYSALAETEFSNFSMPEMTALSEDILADAGAPTSARLVFNDVAIAGLQNGILGLVEVGPVSLQLGRPDGDYELTLGSASADRTDLGALAHIFDPAAYKPGQAQGGWKSVISNIAYSGVSGAGPDGLTLRLDSVALDGLDGRQLDKPFTDIWDQLLDLSVGSETKTELALNLLETYDAWRLGAVSLSGLSIDMPADAIALSLKGLTASGLSSEGVDKLGMSGLIGKMPELFVSLGSLELAGFDAPDLESLLGFAALESNIDLKMHAETIARTIAAFPRLSHLGIIDLVGGKSETDAVSLETLTLDLQDWNDVFAETTDLRVTGLKLPPKLRGPETTQLMQALGYDDIVLGISLLDRWTPEFGTDDATWTFTLRNAGEFQLSYTLTGVTLDWMVRATAAAGATEDSEKAVEAMLNDLRLRRAAVRITDRSLLERAFGYAADAQELDVDGRTYREQMRAALPFLISAAMPPAITKLLARPLQQFLAGSQTLIAEIDPPAPLNMTELLAETDDPLALPGRLNMKLRTEAPAR